MSCGEGIQTRTIGCKDGSKPSTVPCNEFDKPSSIQACHSGIRCPEQKSSGRIWNWSFRKVQPRSTLWVAIFNWKLICLSEDHKVTWSESSRSGEEENEEEGEEERFRQSLMRPYPPAVPLSGPISGPHSGPFAATAEKLVGGDTNPSHPIGAT